MVSSSKPYSFHNLLNLKPGTMVMGLAHTDAYWELAPGWGNASLHEKLIQQEGKLVTRVMTESYWGIRKNCKEFMTTAGKTKVYILPSNWLGRLTSTFSQEKQTTGTAYEKIDFEYGKPVGMYLGHIFRADDVTWVNLLSPGGFDIWF